MEIRPSGDLINAHWDEAEPEDLPRVLAGWAAHLESYDMERRGRNLIYARLATNRDLPNIYGLSMARSGIQALDMSGWKAPVFNVVGSSIETLVNKVGRNKPWILFLTDAGDWASQQAGKARSRFVDGVFHATDTYRKTRQMCQDAATYGDGLIKASISLDGKSIVHDNVIPDELLVDPWDSLYWGQWPRRLIHRTFINRGELLAAYGDDEELRDAIANAPGSFQGPMWMGPANDNSSQSMVAVIEAWALPKPDGTPGRHVMIISDRACLVDEEYDYPRYPFAKMPFVSAGRGFWSIGVPEILGPFQANINRTQQVIDACQARMSTGRWLIPNGSGVTLAMLGNLPGGAVNYNPPNAPSFIAPVAVPAELYKHLEDTIGRAYKRIGISELAAQAMKPQGLNSGEALRAFESSESERYVTFGMSLEDAVTDLAEIDLMLSEKVKMRVQAPRAGGIDVIDWSELPKIKGNRAIMKAFPVSSLPTSPAGRLQRAAEMYQTGQISRDDYLRLIDYPDTEAVIELNTAGRDAIEWMLDKIVEQGVYESPEPYMPLNTAIEVAQNRYLRERTKGCPEDRLELLRRFMDTAQELKPVQAQMQAPPQMNAAQAGAAGLPPPPAPVIGAGNSGPAGLSAVPSALPPPPLQQAA